MKLPVLCCYVSIMGTGRISSVFHLIQCLLGCAVGSCNIARLRLAVKTLTVLFFAVIVNNDCVIDNMHQLDLPCHCLRYPRYTPCVLKYFNFKKIFKFE